MPENRNEELKCELVTDRLSDYRIKANFFRLYLHAAALNLLDRLRRATARPITLNLTDLDRNVPAEALAERNRHTCLNRRHRNHHQRPPCPGPPQRELALRRRIPPHLIIYPLPPA
ncbi:MAG: hypothetical protein NTZ32_19425 [Planctomycetales bacterium]|nr:hypothetical protein [Planctomycetales bacterium]